MLAITRVKTSIALRNDKVEKKITSIIKDSPHTIFFGPSGSGKKTLARTFIERLHGEKLVMSKVQIQVTDTRTVTLLQSDSHIEVKPLGEDQDHKLISKIVSIYAHKMSLSRLLFRSIMILDANKLSYNAQMALRRIAETHTINCRFVFVCKSLTGLITPIVSRCVTFRVPGLTRKKSLELILEISNKIMSIQDHKRIIERANGSIKEILWQLDFIDRDIKETSTGIEDVSNLIATGKIESKNKIRDALYNMVVQTADIGEVIADIARCLLLNYTCPWVPELAAKYANRATIGKGDIIYLEAFSFQCLEKFSL